MIVNGAVRRAGIHLPSGWGSILYTEVFARLPDYQGDLILEIKAGFADFFGESRVAIDLLEGRKVLAFAGHTHTNEVWVPGDELAEWGQATPFTHIIAGAAAGSWWSGAKDERGIPLSYQRDGAPNGYFVIDYSGTDFKPRYKGAGFPLEQQMHLSFRSRNASMLPDGVLTVDELSHTRVVANVWAGSPQSTVTCTYDNGESLEGAHSTTTPAPYALKHQAGLDSGLLTNASPHLWLCPMPTTLAPGSHEVTVSTTDAFDQTFEHSMIFEVWAMQ